MDLVLYAVLQPLVTGGPDKDVRLDHFPGKAIVHDLVSVAVKAMRLQLVRNVFCADPSKRRAISVRTGNGAGFAEQTFHQLPNRHAGGQGIRVDNDVRCHAIQAKGHVFLAVGHANRAFLSVPRTVSSPTGRGVCAGFVKKKIGTWHLNAPDCSREANVLFRLAVLLVHMPMVNLWMVLLFYDSHT